MQAIFKFILSTSAVALTFVGSIESHNFIRHVEAPEGGESGLDFMVTDGCKSYATR
jgi:hypothetical protein